MAAQQPDERCFLCFAQFGELFGNVRYRAVVLADLHTRPDTSRRGCEPGGAEGVGDVGGHVFEFVVRSGFDGFDSAEDGLDTALREVLDCGVTAEFAQVTHRCTGEVVVGMSEPSASDGRELEPFRGTTTSSTLGTCGCRGLGFPGIDECIEVTPNTCGAESELLPDFGGCDRPVFEKKLNDGRAGLPFVRFPSRHCTRNTGCRVLTCNLCARRNTVRDIHNTSVTEFRGRVHQG